MILTNEILGGKQGKTNQEECTHEVNDKLKATIRHLYHQTYLTKNDLPTLSLYVKTDRFSVPVLKRGDEQVPKIGTVCYI